MPLSCGEGPRLGVAESKAQGGSPLQKDFPPWESRIR